MTDKGKKKNVVTKLQGGLNISSFKDDYRTRSFVDLLSSPVTVALTLLAKIYNLLLNINFKNPIIQV